MGATTVTGKGAGAAHNNKGPQNGRNVYQPLLSPHVVAAGNHTLAGTSDTITFPNPLANPAANYVVMLTPAETSSTQPQASDLTDVATQFVSFLITGGNDEAVAWAVMSTGHGIGND